MGRFVTCIVTILAVLTLGFGEPERLEAAIIDGGDFGGNNLTPEDGDILFGTFTNVGLFHIIAGRTVYVAQGVPLSITADQHQIDGTLDGTGRGHLGGDSVQNALFSDIFDCFNANGTTRGNSGSDDGGGTGGSFGCRFSGSGGGGGGYGGAGGQSGSADGNVAPPASGGAENGNESAMSIEMGSGGGSGSDYDADDGNSGAGGRGGGKISLFGQIILTSTGKIIANGAKGQPGLSPLTLSTIGTAAGGGGSGGGILLVNDTNDASELDGELIATGGLGGLLGELPGGIAPHFGSGGGGGGGGRIKYFGPTEFGTNFKCIVSGANGGVFAEDPISSPNPTQATPGGDGTCHDGTTLPNPIVDADGDGVDDSDDLCPGTVIGESVPTKRLGTNRFALVNNDETFDTTSPKGRGPRKAYTIQDTAGCSCEQIIAQRGLGRGHRKFGCSIGTMRRWIRNLN